MSNYLLLKIRQCGGAPSAAAHFD